MARIHSLKDRISVRIGDITIKISPLTTNQKQEIIQQAIIGKAKGSFKDLQQSSIKAVKYAVRSVEGLEDSDGNPYQIKFDENGNLSDETVEDLLNLQINSKLTQICSALAFAIPDQFTDQDGNVLEGVEIIRTDKPAVPNSST